MVFCLLMNNWVSIGILDFLPVGYVYYKQCYYFVRKNGNVYKLIMFKKQSNKLICIVNKYWYFENGNVVSVCLGTVYLHIIGRKLSNKDDSNKLLHYRIPLSYLLKSRISADKFYQFNCKLDNIGQYCNKIINIESRGVVGM